MLPAMILILSTSQEMGCEKHPWNDLFSVEWAINTSTQLIYLLTMVLWQGSYWAGIGKASEKWATFTCGQGILDIWLPLWRAGISLYCYSSLTAEINCNKCRHHV